jgi:3-keto-disaccharide hydrolase
MSVLLRIGFFFRRACLIFLIFPVMLTLLLAGCTSEAVTSPSQATQTIAPTPTPTPTFTPTPTPVANPYPPYTGTLVWNDPLTDNFQGHNWDESNFNGNSCWFSGGAYDVSSTPPGSNTCYERANQFSNFALQVTVTVLQTHSHNDGAGITFRSNGNSIPSGKFYYLVLYTSGQYYLGSCFPPSGCLGAIVLQGVCHVCHFGPSQATTIGLVANGKHFTFYANGQKLASGTDATFSQGLIGLEGEGYPSTSIVAYKDLKIWQL